jgi:hypothetical protein
MRDLGYCISSLVLEAEIDNVEPALLTRTLEQHHYKLYYLRATIMLVALTPPREGT